MAAASASVLVWFRLEGGAPDKVRIETSSDIVDLRDAVYAKVKAELEPRGITARLLVLSTADGKTTYSRGSQPVSTIDATTEDIPLIVTGAFVCAAWSPFAAAYGSRSSSGGRTWTRPRHFRYADLSCCVRVRVRVRCACTWRCAVLLVDSFVEFCSSVEFCVSQVVTVAPSLRNWMWFSRA